MRSQTVSYQTIFKLVTNQSVINGDILVSPTTFPALHSLISVTLSWKSEREPFARVVPLCLRSNLVSPFFCETSFPLTLTAG